MAVILLILIIVVLNSRTRIYKTYEKYMRVDNKLNITGKQLAFFAKAHLGLTELQFALTKRKLGDAYVYKHKTSGKVIALCRENWRLDRNGWQLWRDYPDEEPYCVTTFEENDSFVQGTPIDPAGFAEVDKTAVLDKSEFELLWLDSDLVPDIHIPPGGGMTVERCEKSLKDAIKFFKQYLKCEPKAFTCFSWVFNPDFCQVLPESNMAKFMHNVYLTPLSGSSLSGLSFVFGKSDKNWSDYPAEKSLQKAFHTLRKQGKRLKMGGMFIEAAGISNFNTNYYCCKYQELHGTLHGKEVFQYKDVSND